ncbi:MAG: carboxypeptidase-like regulatory domain-containing protein [Planctomycetaceae bacterium]|jgi:hypothetical protein|nr:carboxypeptidase-like regulatory domain-containing protein [Planctomycetaceae bacterium]
MKYKYFLFVSVLLFVIGCGDSPRPKDLPPLFLCTITVTQDGKPLSDAVVKLVTQENNTAKYTPVAMTGSDGKVIVSTYGFSGAPAGKYKVVVSKNIEDDIVYKTNADGEQEIVTYKTYRTVEKIFSNTETTPLEIEITPKNKNTEKTFDVGKPAKEFLSNQSG